MFKYLIRMRLKTQLLLLFVVLILITVFSFNYLHFLNEERMLELVEEQIDELSRAIQVSYEQITAEGPTDEERLSNYITQLKRKGIKEISIMNNDQEVVASTNPSRKGTRISVSKNEFVIKTVLGEEGNIAKKMYNVIIPIVVKNTQIGYAHISIYVDDIEALSREMFLKRILLTMLIFGIGLVFSYLIAHRFTMPISNLIKGAKEIVDGRLKPFEGKYYGELSDLVNAYNEMVLKLKERQDLQEQLKRTEQQAMLGQLASGIAHEIKNPVNFISLSLDHLASILARTNNISQSETDELIKRIKEEIQRINHMLNNFLDLGRELIISPITIRANAVLEDCLSLVSSRLNTHRIELIKEFTPIIPEVKMDIDKMKSCFLNILNNSIDAMPDGGKIIVSLSREDNLVVYKFKDTGEGIKEEDLEHVFEPYFTTKKNGIGLGLAITRRIVRAHGGEVILKSESGKGTEVTIKIPG